MQGVNNSFLINTQLRQTLRGHQLAYNMPTMTSFITRPPLSCDTFTAPPLISELIFTWTLTSQPCRSKTWTHRTCCLLTAMCNALHWLLLTVFTWAPYCSSSNITSAWSLPHTQFLFQRPSFCSHSGSSPVLQIRTSEETYSSVGKLLWQNYYVNTTKYFYLHISISTRDLYQKKFVQLFFRFLPW